MLPIVRRMAVTLTLLAGFLAPASAHASRVLASSVMSPARGGKLTALNGVSIRVPAGVMRRRGRVTITRVRPDIYSVHIGAPWHGTVAVSLPLRSHSGMILHNVGGVWLNESQDPGARTVYVTQLSLFGFLGKVAGKLCLTFNLVAFVECVGGKLDSKLKSWLESKLPHDCAVQLAEGGNPLAIAKAAVSGGCVGHVGETGYHYPTGGSGSPGGSGSATGGGSTGGGSSGSTGGGSTGSGSGGSAGGGATGGGSASVSLAQGPTAPAGYRYAITLSGFPATTPIQVECYDSVDPGGFYSFVLTTDAGGGAYTASYCYSGDGPDHWVVAGGVGSNHAAWGGGAPTPPPSPTYSETTGGVAHTWTNYTNAGGYEGPSIPSNATVQISCKLAGFTVQDGNSWWYRIASSPWSNGYYVSADAFYNTPGQTSGSLVGTPFVDPAVADC